MLLSNLRKEGGKCHLNSWMLCRIDCSFNNNDIYFVVRVLFDILCSGKDTRVIWGWQRFMYARKRQSPNRNLHEWPTKTCGFIHRHPNQRADIKEGTVDAIDLCQDFGVRLKPVWRNTTIIPFWHNALKYRKVHLVIPTQSCTRMQSLHFKICYKNAKFIYANLLNPTAVCRRSSLYYIYCINVIEKCIIPLSCPSVHLSKKLFSSTAEPI